MSVECLVRKFAEIETGRSMDQEDVIRLFTEALDQYLLVFLMCDCQKEGVKKTCLIPSNLKL
jgi:hypothetical protein